MRLATCPLLQRRELIRVVGAGTRSGLRALLLLAVDVVHIWRLVALIASKDRDVEAVVDDVDW